MICQYYDNPAQRHLRISKIVELFSQNYYFSEMKKKIKQYINKYQSCQINKYLTHTLYKYI